MPFLNLYTVRSRRPLGFAPFITLPSWLNFSNINSATRIRSICVSSRRNEPAPTVQPESQPDVCRGGTAGRTFAFIAISFAIPIPASNNRHQKFASFVPLFRSVGSVQADCSPPSLLPYSFLYLSSSWFTLSSWLGCISFTFRFSAAS